MKNQHLWKLWHGFSSGHSQESNVEIRSFFWAVFFFSPNTGICGSESAESVDSFHAVNIPGIFCAKILIFGERRRGTYKSFT